MTTHHFTTTMAHDDSGGDGPVVLLIPGAGDVRSENRFLAELLERQGFRVINADLPGHGDSPIAPAYTVESTASAIVELVERLDAAPVTVVANSFAPAAAVWAATERPDLFSGLVAISPHLHAENSLSASIVSISMRLLLRGPWAAGLWAKLYTGWYKTNPPTDLEHELSKLKSMLSDKDRRRAVRLTLTADRRGMEERIARLRLPTLTIFGSADDHFSDPVATAEATAAELGGGRLLVDGAGHYPHVEDPTSVARAVVEFIRSA